MDEGPLYVYGVTHSGAVDVAGMAGLDGRAIRSVAADGVAAFVSDAPSGAIETTRERLLTHARVLEHLAAERTVLPMRFGVVAPSERALREGVLSPRRRVFATLLDRLEGTVEVDLRVLYDEAALVSSGRCRRTRSSTSTCSRPDGGGARGPREAARAAAARAGPRRGVAHRTRRRGRAGRARRSGRDQGATAGRAARFRARR